MSNAKVSSGAKEQANVARSPRTPMPPSIVVPASSASYWSALNANGAQSVLAASGIAKAPSAILGPRLSRVMAFIDDNITLDLCVATLAQVAGMSSFYFCRSFKQSTGITPHQFVLGRRMELAKQLLQQERIPLMEVAQKVGFSDQSQFTRVFRKIVGTTPSQFRKHGVGIG